ncbi:MAG: prolipoprotein diacylglyceryl transferase [Zoogloeaceae bacterium]|jgi:phosphatidylglycerol:prolipoprotein diacylglycerol transferase|nr:prolipoprotein diacylglyceryl transferase [Zoogloeaceae bacterium]
MLAYPDFDPVAFHVLGFPVHWYGLMYLFAFIQFLLLGRWRIRQAGVAAPLSSEQLDDLLFFGVLGVIVGGRLGEVLFYAPGFYFSHPGQIIAVWKGGMSFHGGFLGVLIATLWWARRHRIAFWTLMDFTAPLTPLGLMAGRIGNFINGELWGRVASPDLPWAMIFPRADNLPRHPSQLYHALLEGLLLFVVLWLFSKKPRPAGAVSGLFLIGYGLCRFTVEFFREPDSGIFGLSYTVSMGQWLSLPMILVGIGLLVWAYKKKADQKTGD